MAAWRMNGDVLIACNCDWGCPCNFNARPSHGHCEGGWIWMIEKGHVTGVALDGLGIALFAKWPGAIHEGGGRAVSYLDERADAAQRSALTGVLRGDLGGPWGLFIKTYELAAPAPPGSTCCWRSTAHARRSAPRSNWSCRRSATR